MPPVTFARERPRNLVDTAIRRYPESMFPLGCSEGKHREHSGWATKKPRNGAKFEEAERALGPFGLSRNPAVNYEGASGDRHGVRITSSPPAMERLDVSAAICSRSPEAPALPGRRASG